MRRWQAYAVDASMLFRPTLGSDYFIGRMARVTLKFNPEHYFGDLFAFLPGRYNLFMVRLIESLTGR